MNRLIKHISHSLLISLVLAFIAGIILQHLLPLPRSSLLIFCILLFFLSLFHHRQSRTQTFYLALLLLLTGIGCLYSAPHPEPENGKKTLFAKIPAEKDALLTGTLLKMPEYDGEQTKIILKSDHIRLKDEPFFTPVKGLVQLRLKDSWPEEYLPGDALVIRARLSRPYRFANPGSFNYPRYLAQKGIRIIGRISSTAHISTLQRKTEWFQSLQSFPERTRVHIREQINAVLPPPEAELYRALLIGDRSGLTQEQLESFKAAGVFHILAISGLHLSVVASALFVIFYWLARRSSRLMLRLSVKKLALMATIPPLFMYALLAGAQTPVLRAVIMITVFIVSFCLQRIRSPFTTLAVAALILLLINPTTLFSASFHLSFAAVISLIVIFPRLQTLLDSGTHSRKTTITISTQALRWILAALLTSTAAIAGTAPLLIYDFNRISTAGIITNLIIEPLLCLWSLPLGLLSLLIHPLSPFLAGLFIKTGATGLRVAMDITSFCAGSTLSSLWFPTPSVLIILLYYLTLLWWLSAPASRKALLCFCMICFLFFLPPRTVLSNFSKGSELVFLDVGQGNATYVSLPGGKNALIDGGGGFSKRYNPGENIIAPYLWYRGVRRLTAVVITHPDSDHSNGIPFILRHFRPETLWVNGSDGTTEGYQQLLQLAEDLNISVKYPADNQILMRVDGVILKNLRNPLHWRKTPSPNQRHVDSNDKSLIIRFSDSRGTDHLSCLLPGDISKKVEKELLQEPDTEELQATVLLSPHHGSRTSNSDQFLQRVNPRILVVSAGRFRPNIFPSQHLRDSCSKYGITLLNTAEKGAIRITATATGTIRTTTFK